MPLISSLGVMNAINFGLASSATSVKKQALAMFTGAWPYITAYPVNSKNGYSAKYADPATVPTGTAMNGCFSKDNSVIASALYVPPYVIAYPFTIASGFGTKYANPSDASSSICYDCEFTPTKSHLVVANNSASTGLYAYAWSSGFGTRTYAGTQPPGAINSLNFNKTGSDLAIGHQNSPYIAAYAWSNGFGAKYANPSPLPAGPSIEVAFNPATGNCLAYCSEYNSPYVFVHNWSNGFGTRYSNPASLPPSTVISIAFSPLGNYLAVYASGASFGIYVYNWSDTTGFGSRISSPYTGTLPPSSGNNNVKFDATGKMIGCAARSAAYNLATFSWTGAFGDIYSQPSTVDSYGNITFTN